MTFGESVRVKMEENHITQNELARLANLSSSGISTALRNDGNPRLQTVMAIAKVLNCTVAELIGEGPHEAKALNLDIVEIKLLGLFRSLNAGGQDRLIEYAQDMAQLAKWTKEKTTKAV